MARLILIADDSPTIQRKAQKILEGQGFEVETVSNGVAAIKKLPTLQPVLVLADVSMPGKDGYEVCDFVKTSANLVHVPVLLVGSDLEPYDEQRGTQVRADGIIKKPFTPQDLIAIVAKFTAPACPSTLPGTLAAPSPAELPEVSPMGAGPERSTTSQEQDLAALLAGSAFAGRPLDEIPAMPPEPLPDIFLQPSSEPVLQASPETSLAPTEPFPGFALGVTPEPAPERVPEAAPEPIWVSPELISGTAPETLTEPSPVPAELAAEPAPEAAPETASVSLELISEAVPGATPEQVSVVQEPVAESGSPLTLEPVPETAHLPAEAAPETPPGVPLEGIPPLTKPILEEEPVEPIHLDVSPPETVAGPAPAAELTPASAEAAGTPSVIDPEWVHVVVQRVVTKMAPSILSPELVKDLVRILTEEISADLAGPSPSSDARGPAGP